MVYAKQSIIPRGVHKIHVAKRCVLCLKWKHSLQYNTSLSFTAILNTLLQTLTTIKYNIQPEDAAKMMKWPNEKRHYKFEGLAPCALGNIAKMIHQIFENSKQRHWIDIDCQYIFHIRPIETFFSCVECTKIKSL